MNLAPNIHTTAAIARNVVKTCTCCARAFTLSEWEDLPEVGTQPDEPGWMLVLRNCPCGSTLAVRTEAER